MRTTVCRRISACCADQGAAPGMLHRARYTQAACCRAILRAARCVEQRAALSKWRRAAGGVQQATPAQQVAPAQQAAPAGGAGGGAGPAGGAEQRAVSVRCVELRAVIQDCAELAGPGMLRRSHTLPAPTPCASPFTAVNQSASFVDSRFC
ncbi:hypothetical protein T492DRAFT_216600 [Pavlovales sp. CCMP2436]|nr:hypothetical protein T492DRAFT_216600 [Pavlovales sp. CCMP2436]